MGDAGPVGALQLDLVDNLGRASPRTLVGLPPPLVGDPFTRAAGRKIGKVLSVQAPRELTGQIAGIVISYLLVDVPDAGGCRLLMKLVSDMPRVFGPALAVGDLVMARRQLLNWKKLAEREARRRPSG